MLETIDILLATYHPKREWLDEQIASIYAQTGNYRINLIVREDVEGVGVAANFSKLLEQSSAKYLAFSDQDDVWLPNKIEKLMAKMKEMERKYGAHFPLLVFSDLKIVDEKLCVIDQSYFHYNHINPKRNKPRQLISQNTASGNTILFNAPLRDLVKKIPLGAFMHDSWVMLCAASFGKIGYVPESTILYRQHNANVIGARKCDFMYFVRKLFDGISQVRKRQYQNITQIEAFVQQFGDISPRAFKAICGFRHRNWFMRRYLILRYGMFKSGLLRNLGLLLVI